MPRDCDARRRLPGGAWGGGRTPHYARLGAADCILVSIPNAPRDRDATARLDTSGRDVVVGEALPTAVTDALTQRFSVKRVVDTVYPPQFAVPSVAVWEDGRLKGRLIPIYLGLRRCQDEMGQRSVGSGSETFCRHVVNRAEFEPFTEFGKEATM